jgi:hypothetical protein
MYATLGTHDKRSDHGVMTPTAWVDAQEQKRAQLTPCSGGIMRPEPVSSGPTQSLATLNYNEAEVAELRLTRRKHDLSDHGER